MPVSPFATDFAQALIDFDFNVKTIAVWTNSEVNDGQGGQILTPILFSSSDGFIFPMKGREKVAAGRLETDQLFKILVFPIVNITTKMKVIYKSEDYNIRSISDVAEDGSLMILIAEKGVAQ